MAPEKRLGSIELNGVDYPLNYCIRNANEISEALAAPEDGAYGAYGTAVKNIHVLSLLLRDGADYMRHFHGETVTPPTEQELLCLLTLSDNKRVVAAVREAIELGGMRLVEVAGKKAAAAPTKGRD